MPRDAEAQFQREQLHHAAAKGDVAKVETLLARGYPVNRFDDTGVTPLHYAVRGGHLEVVDRLLGAGADVNRHCGRLIGETPLGEAIETCSYAMAERLIRAGADPTIPGWMQLTALHRAANRKDEEGKRILRLLESTKR